MSHDGNLSTETVVQTHQSSAHVQQLHNQYLVYANEQAQPRNVQLLRSHYGNVAMNTSSKTKPQSRHKEKTSEPSAKHTHSPQAMRIRQQTKGRVHAEA